MVLVGKINRELVSAVNALEPVAVGVAGEDGRLLEAAQIDPKLGFVGKVGNVRAGLLHALLDDGLVPIVSTVGADSTGQPFNVNADDAARAIAVAMKAEKIIYLTAAPGLLENPADPASLVHHLSAAEARRRIADESVTGGMIPKCSPARGGRGRRRSANMIDGGPSMLFSSSSFTTRGSATMVSGEADNDRQIQRQRMIADWLARSGRQPRRRSSLACRWLGSPRPRRLLSRDLLELARGQAQARSSIRYVMPDQVEPATPPPSSTAACGMGRMQSFGRKPAGAQDRQARQILSPMRSTRPGWMKSREHWPATIRFSWRCPTVRIPIRLPSCCRGAGREPKSAMARCDADWR